MLLDLGLLLHLNLRLGEELDLLLLLLLLIPLLLWLLLSVIVHRECRKVRYAHGEVRCAGAPAHARSTHSAVTIANITITGRAESSTDTNARDKRPIRERVDSSGRGEVRDLLETLFKVLARAGAGLGIASERRTTEAYLCRRWLIRELAWSRRPRFTSGSRHHAVLVRRKRRGFMKL